MPGYIPNADAPFRDWGQNFADRIALDPAHYALLAADSTIISDAQADFATKLALATDPATRTNATIAAKDGAKAFARDYFQWYAQFIKLNLGISNDDKVALGIHIDDGNPTPIAPPTQAPLVNVEGLVVGGFTLRARNPDNPFSRGKPPGVTMCIIMIGYGLQGSAALPFTLDLFKLVSSKPINVLMAEAGTSGKLATAYVVYANAKGQMGPPSAAIQFTIP